MSANQLEYNEKGYLLIKDFFDKQLLTSILNEARATFAVQIERTLGNCPAIDQKNAFENAMFQYFEKDMASFIGTGKNVQHSLSLYRLNTDEKIVKLLKDIGLTQPTIGVKPSMQFNSRYLTKGSNHWKLGAHQDWRSGQGSLDSAVIWFPLVDCNHDLGVLQLVEGSHKKGLMASNGVSYEGSLQDDYADELYKEFDMKVGDLLLFSALLVHRSGENTTQNIRWSVQYRFNNLAEKTFIERGFPHSYDYKPQENLITPNFPSLAQIEQIYSSK